MNHSPQVPGGLTPSSCGSAARRDWGVLVRGGEARPGCAGGVSGTAGRERLGAFPLHAVTTRMGGGSAPVTRRESPTHQHSQTGSTSHHAAYGASQ